MPAAVRILSGVRSFPMTVGSLVVSGPFQLPPGAYDVRLGPLVAPDVFFTFRVNDGTTSSLPSALVLNANIYATAIFRTGSVVLTSQDTSGAVPSYPVVFTPLGFVP